MISFDESLSLWVLWKFPGSNSNYASVDCKLYSTLSAISIITTKYQQCNRMNQIKIKSIEIWCRAMGYVSIGKCRAYDGVFILIIISFQPFWTLTSYPTSHQWSCIIETVIAQVIVIVSEWVVVIIDIVVGSSAAVLVILMIVVEVAEFKDCCCRRNHCYYCCVVDTVVAVSTEIEGLA